MSSFWDSLQKTSKRLHHELNLAGKTLARCPGDKCKNGIIEPGYTDYDGYGSIWRDPVQCRVCGGRGQVEVACSPELEIAAINIEIAGLKDRLKKLKKRAK